MPTYRAYAIVGAVAAIATLVATPLVRRLAIRIGAVVEPDERRIHTRPTPRWAASRCSWASARRWRPRGRWTAFNDVFLQSSEPLGVLPAAVMVLVGSADDLREWSAPAKVAGQVLSATLLWWFGVVMFYFSLPFLDLVVLSNDIKPLVTVLWVLGIANAINLIDGLDGLAAGITAIASGAFFLTPPFAVGASASARHPHIASCSRSSCSACAWALPVNSIPRVAS